MRSGLNGRAIRYAVRIARRTGMREIYIRLMLNMVLAEGSGLESSTNPRGARILAVVGAFEGLLLLGRDREEALTQIKRRSGTHLDPNIVDVFLSIIREDASASLLATVA